MSRPFGNIRGKTPSSSKKQLAPPQSSSGSSRGSHSPLGNPFHSPQIREHHDDNDSVGMGTCGWESKVPVDISKTKLKGKETAGKIRGKKRPNQDAHSREQIFNQLAYCGFLDVTWAHLVRWAVMVAWDFQIHKATWVVFSSL